MEKECVDILLPTYNSNLRYLSEQIDSILNQSYENIKLYISDDNSKKHEVIDFLKELEHRDSRVKIYYQNKNLGYIKNFEFLLTKSKSDYIAFSDHDDLWYSNKIEILIRKIKETKTSLVYSDCRYINEAGKILKESYMNYKNLPFIAGRNINLAFSRHIAIGCAQLFTKDVKDIILPFSKAATVHDWITIYAASKLNGISYIDKPLFSYRTHAANIFGGKNVAKENLIKARKQNGRYYAAFLDYRKDIIDVYYKGAYMCYLKYKEKKFTATEEENMIKYYQNVRRARYMNLNICKYYKYLVDKHIGKKQIKELMLFHFPIIVYIKFIV